MFAAGGRSRRATSRWRRRPQVRALGWSIVIAATPKRNRSGRPAVRAQAGSSVVPDDRRRVERDLPSSVEDAPAKVDVVAGRGVHGVEASDLDESLPP